MIGSKLAHFQITAKLGQGGMGEVYLAEDTKLGRQVALKVLPEVFVADPERLGRFEREAKVLASLSHPNIAGIHEVGEEGSTHFLVMELAPGETLGQRIARGPLPIDDTVGIALQIGRGLEAAHERGIVHRDLKPGNVMVDEKGEVKILDFGLAKALAPEPGSQSAAEVAHSPTLTYQATVAGALLGTAAYMSPEQARGEVADRRSDIWSFGVVLWEMLTGRKLFEGRTVSDTLAGILRDEIDIGSLPASCPAALRRLLGRCLERDADRRLHDVADARVVLQDLADGVIEEEPIQASADAGRGRRKESLAWVVALFFFFSTLGTTWLAFIGTDPAPPLPAVSAHILPPPGSLFEFGDKHVGSLALSPDGRQLVFGALSQEERVRQLYVRALDSTTAAPLPGTEGATFPFWSPDSRQVAFFSGGKLKRLEIGAGTPLTICDAGDGRGGAWGADNVIVFAPWTQGPLYRVSAAGGGTPEPVTVLDASLDESTHRLPFFLPDGRRFLFSTGGPGDSQGQTYATWLASLDSPGRTKILDHGFKTTLANAHLLSIRDGFLMAQPFDAQASQLTGSPFLVTEKVLYNPENQGAAFTTASSGSLVYYPSDIREIQLVLMDRSGRELQSIGEPGAYRFVNLSPDGNRVVATLSEGGGGSSDLWVFDLATGGKTRLTFQPGSDYGGVWSPDGSRIAYAATGRDGAGGSNSDIMVRDASGGGVAEELLATEAFEVPWDWSPDGKYLLFNRRVDANLDLWVLPLQGGEPFPVVSDSAMEGWGHFSPDGRWVTYISNESGDWQAFATPFPDSGGTWQLTSDAEGASWLVDWTEDGIHHVTTGQMLAVLDVTTDEGSIRAGRRQQLMPSRSEVTWAVSRDGQRFVVGRPRHEESNQPLTLVTDWLAGVR